jgi:putative ABC transport system permease protein
VVVVNDAFVSRYFPRIDPIGQVLRFNAGTARATDLRIVGVVGSTHQAGLDEAPAPEIFSPHTQSTWPAMALVLRTTAAPSALIPTVQRALFTLDPTLPAFDVKTMNERLDDSVAQRRFHMLLLGLFATIALLLAAIGVYGVIAYGVSRRTQEIGIRLALGAQRSDVLRLVVGQGLRLTIIGIGAGLAVAFAARRLIASLVFGVTVDDPITFAGASVLLAAIALLACWLPARRASRVDPVIALYPE